ncbi:MAG: FtsX-like permease family protein [Candidatus Harrisonbacteria bacterium]|nr:FtsX-like permease family protein [Candidatus Harrisonbacteria bacterium]
MLFKDIIKTASNGLTTNKARSALTILGIIIGIASIIIVMSIGRSSQELILSQIRGIGADVISIEPGRKPVGPSNFSEVFTDSLKKRDLEALMDTKRITGVRDVAPTIMRAVPVGHLGETYRANIVGTTELLADIFDMKPSEGYFFNEEDIKSKAALAVIGADVKKELFGDREAIGERIKIKGKNFVIIGTIPSKGQLSLFNPDKMVFIPYSTAQTYVFGIQYFNSIIVQTDNENITDQVANRIKELIRENHGITDPDKDDFHINTQKEAIERVSLITNVLTALLIAVAAISLVVGGVGIMNIMFVSVSERTREIGLRKALGATDKDILWQFLTEAVFLTGLGGILGISLGSGISFIVVIILKKFVSTEWTYIFPVESAVIGIVVSSIVGLVFGIYPARKASRKSPIEALRYE